MYARDHGEDIACETLPMEIPLFPALGRTQWLPHSRSPISPSILKAEETPSGVEMRNACFDVETTHQRLSFVPCAVSRPHARSVQYHRRMQKPAVGHGSDNEAWLVRGRAYRMPCCDVKNTQDRLERSVRVNKYRIARKAMSMTRRCS